MGKHEGDENSHTPANWQFKTTDWIRVRKAGQADDHSSSAEALAQLCRDYRYPLYAYARRRGSSPEDAEDLTQSFFARLLEKQSLRRADRARGRFRSFLLTSFDRFVTNEWEKLKAVKRGGRCSFVSWDALEAEKRYCQEPSSDLSAEKLYERNWARVLLDKAIEQLRRDHDRARETAIFEALQGFLNGIDEPESYKAVATRLGLTENAVRMRVYRLRQLFGTVLRQVVADTVDEAEVDAELKHLLTVWD